MVKTMTLGTNPLSEGRYPRLTLPPCAGRYCHAPGGQINWLDIAVFHSDNDDFTYKISRHDNNI
jgi:hypothetical protein